MAASANNLVAQNKRARHDYFIEDVVEGGLVLTGSEVKSLRQGRASILESYASEENGEMFLVNAHIPTYDAANRFNHEPKRPRKILLKRREMAKMIGMVHREGYTVVPVSLYFNKRGIAKVGLGLARGKKQVDKRQTEKKRDWQRDKARLLRSKTL
ncbi:SsrA-binding protein SmpB [Denitrobaculum tricleocarpae]|uniref:SsrA-binding protein n=1 Tax=Denitrobaculum tricleocarpae TaxID=2591009 RepID=A0A545TTS0_9PROT|nr:SsrA-binding protein SmpB [Denitrobaculum tricleocarpae]TQV80614.1 SsrA-binding protein SmpB [Denitrobaculum tricleocarpae]